MTCQLERPTPQALFDRVKNMLSANVLGGAEVIPESNEWYVAALNYAMMEEFYAISEQTWREQDPRFACADNLVAMAARDGVVPRGPTYAQGYIQLTGTAGAALPAPLEVVIGGKSYVTAAPELQPSTIGTDGTAFVRVRSLVAGAAGNISGQTGRLNQAITDVDREVTLAGNVFCNGNDPEDTETFRQRYLARLQYQPRANNTWMIEKLLEWPCATRAMVRAGSCCNCTDCVDGNQCGDCGCKDCGGKQEYYVMFDNTFDCGIAPASVVEEITQWMYGPLQGYGLGQVEVGVCGRVVPVTAIPVNVFIDIVACPTAAQLTQIETLVREYFTTIEPSAPLKARVIESVVATVIGANADYEVRFALENASDLANLDDYVDGCDLQPSCDYLTCLNSFTINGPTATAQSGPFSENVTSDTFPVGASDVTNTSLGTFRTRRVTQGSAC